MSQAKRNWKSFDYNSWKLVVSPSAIETADDCMRKWWNLKVNRLAEPAKDFTQLGDVFHEVCERWLEADDTGRNSEGKQVDVFPPGWADRLSFGQEAVVRALFKAMVDEGILRRTPGRQIEKSFQIEVIPEASMMGFADVWTPQGIEDHKTTKNRRYLATREDLKQNIQMMSYAAAWLVETAEKLGEVPNNIELRHNQGITDPEDLYVRPTAVQVTMNEVSDFWEQRIVPLVKQMLHWKQSKLSPESWEKVPGPSKKGICKKYGGCPFQGICGRTESVDQYRARVRLHNQKFEATLAQENEMSEDLLAKLAARKKARASAGVTTTPSEDAKEAAQAAETAAEEVESVADAVSTQEVLSAPWAQPDCKACSGSGISSSGAVCRPCAVKAEKKGIMATDFKLSATEGAVEIRRGDNLIVSIPVATKVKAADNTKPSPKKPKKTKPEKSEEPTAPPASQLDSESKSKGRPKKGFTMIYGTLKRGRGTVIDLQQVLQEYGSALAEEWNAGSYWALDAFKRREALAHKAEEISASFGPAIVTVTTDQRDLVDFAAALEPFAAAVFLGGVR